MTRALPYRRSAGVALVNRAGEVVHRPARAQPRGDAWSPATNGRCRRAASTKAKSRYAGALRELYEETNVRSVSLIAEAPDWLSYDLPDGIAATAGAAATAARPRSGSCCASRARKRRSTSASPAGGAHKPEFDAWRWERFDAPARTGRESETRLIQ